MAPKRKESEPKRVCSIIEMRVFLHKYNQYGIKVIKDIPGQT